MDPNYQSSIPEPAEEHVAEVYAGGQNMKMACPMARPNNGRVKGS